MHRPTLSRGLVNTAHNKTESGLTVVPWSYSSVTGKLLGLASAVRPPGLTSHPSSLLADTRHRLHFSVVQFLPS